MGLEELKKSLGGGNFKSLLKTTTKNKKKRIISDVEFLSEEQYKFLEAHTQKHFFSFMEQYWGEKMTEAGITCRTFDGEVLNVEPGSIRVIDKRWKGASHCICGKAIRYEYWIQHYGPIGSVHIIEHTNLDKTLVADITKGYKKQNELRTEIVRILADLKEDNRTLDDWKKTFDLEEKMKYIDAVRHLGKRELIKGLYDLNLPLSETLRHELTLAASRAKRSTSGSTTPNLSSNLHKQLLVDIVSEVEKYKTGNYKGFSSHQMKTLSDLQRSLERGKPSPAQVSYANSLLNKLREACQSEASAEWRLAQATAQLILTTVIAEDPTNLFVDSLLTACQRGTLTETQLDCIFRKEKKRGCPGLYYQFESLMKAKQITPVNIESYHE